MYLIKLLRVAPLSGTAVFLCLATIFWCIRVVRRCRYRPDRFLLGLLGLVAISQGLRILQEAGAWTSADTFRRLNDFVNFTTAGFYLIAVFFLEFSNRERITAKVGLRILEGTQPNLNGAPMLLVDRPILVLASDGSITDCNKAAETALERDRAQIVGTRLTFEADLRTGEPPTLVTSAAEHENHAKHTP